MRNLIIEEIMREIQFDKQAARQLLAARTAILYERLPRVAEIDREQNAQGINFVRDAMAPGGYEDHVAEYRSKQEALSAERARLLYENGYDETFFTDVYKCAACEDTGFVNRRHCACLRQRVITRSFDMSNLGEVFREENFETFDINYYSPITDEDVGMSPRDNMRRIYVAALDFVENFGVGFDNLLLYGHTGRGKTFLSNCIAGELLQKGHTVLYATAPQLFRRVEEERFGKGDKGKNGFSTNFAYEADLLIIDDLGTEFATVVTDSELFSFINTRLLLKRPTIISTNLTPTNIDESYSNRISSRIYGNYIAHHFFGEDIRKAKKFGMV